MAQIYNSDLTEALVKGAKIAVAVDKVPDQLGQTVVPVLDVTPRVHRVAIARSVASSSTGGATIFTTPTNKDFYLTGLFISMSDNAACDGIYVRIQATINTTVYDLIRLQKQTLVATNLQDGISFSVPIKIDKGTGINMDNNFSVGTSVRAASIFGFEVDI
jgi:hypothetical protein